MITASKTYSGEIYNICSGIGYSVPDILNTFSSVLKININPIYSDPSMYWKNLGIYIIIRQFQKNANKEVNKNSIGDPTKTKRNLILRLNTISEVV